MAKPKQIILTEDGVITQEALVAYSQGRLSPEEVVRLEKLLRDDPFAQDALEGIRSAAAPAEMKAVVTSLNTQLRERTGAREKKKKGIEIHWATYAYAAVIVGVLIGLGFVMVHFIAQNDQKLAMNKKAPEAEESKPQVEAQPAMIPDTTQIAPASGTTTLNIADSVTINLNAASGASAVSQGTYTTTQDQEKSAPPKPVVADAKKTDKAQQTKTTTAGHTEADKAITINGGREDETQYIVNGHRVVDQKDKAADDRKKLQETTTSSNAVARTAGVSAPAPMTNSAITSKEKKELTKEEKTKLNASANLKAARVFFDAGDFKEAGKKYNEVLSDQPDNMDALFFGGISEYKTGKLKPAEKSFDKLIRSNQYVDGSKWYKANVLIERGKKDEAKQLLRDLINTPNPYKDRAVKKYEEILK